MHLEKLLLKSLTSNYFNAVLLPCAGSLKVIEVDINITTSVIAVLPFCNSGSNHLTNLEFLSWEVVTLWAESLNSRSNSAEYAY